jgi:predicted site-specific integrase-resolvase
LTFLAAQTVAQRLGVKTQTLGKWRRTGRGPKGWIYVSTTLVCYPTEEVDRFIEERSRTRPAFSTLPTR